nr:FAD-dependent oxidoreductase [uncultured Rhodopila sp.]
MRLTHPSIRPAGQPIGFQFNGLPVEALEGETIAAALAAAGITTLRHTPSGAPRGVFCGAGACWDCVVTVNGRVGQRACKTLAADGAIVSSIAPDAFPIPGEAAAAEERVCDILVIGGGPAGLSAATAAARAGASVVLLDEGQAPGGQYARPLSPSHTTIEPDKQFRLGIELRGQAIQAGVRLESDALVWGAFAPDEIAALVRGKSIVYRPRRLILATGAYETPVPVPGWTLPGVMTTGGLQTLARSQRVIPGQKILLAGNGPLNLKLACELVASGIKPVAVLEAASRPGALQYPDILKMSWWGGDLLREGRDLVRTLKQAKVPILWNTALDRLEGDGRVETAVAGAQRFEVDVVGLHVGFQPETGLARALGVPQRWINVGAGYLATKADEDGRTAVENVFAVGDSTVIGGARIAQWQGWLTGQAVARDLGLTAPPLERARIAAARAVHFQQSLAFIFDADRVKIADETVVCRCEEITAATLRAEIAAGVTSLPALKKATRAGMGECQGRFCAHTVARLCPDLQEDSAFAAPRAPLRPVPIAALAREAQEFTPVALHEPPLPVHLHAIPALPVEDRHAAVLVIGGGVVGLSAAYYLARGGADVLVLDRDEVAMAASTANAGSLHVQLQSSEFSYSTPPDGGPAGPALLLPARSIALWKEIAAEAGDDLGLRTEGGLMLAEDQAGLDWLYRKSAMERSWGVESYVLGSNDLRNMAPAVSENIPGAAFVPAEGYGDPLRSVTALLRLARAHGARVLRGAEVTGIERSGSGWTVATNKGEVTAGQVVNATGPWAARTARMVGLSLPVTGSVQQVIVTDTAPAFTRHLVSMANRHLSVKQQANGSFLVGGGWYGGFDAATGRSSNQRQSIEGNLWVAARAVPVLRSLSMVRAWTGINPAIDGAPLLGEAPGVPGFYNAVTANGYTLGLIAGQLTAAAILRGEAIDPRYRLERFG